MLFKSFVSAALVGAVLAQPLQQHQHHEHKMEKKDVKVVTQTSVVKVTVGANTYTEPVEVSSSAVDVTSATDAAQYRPSSFSNPSTFETQTTTGSASESTDASSTSSGSDSTSSGVGKGGAKGITYSPYSDDGGCKSSSQIQKEISQLSGFDIIRLYGVDCDQVAQVLSSKTSSQKVFAGIFDVNNIESGVESLASAVKSSGSWDDIHTVSIGNELVNNGEATASQIATYVKSGKAALKSAGYSGKVVSVDTFIAVINNPDLCDHSDYMAVNAHAFFDGHVSADQAGTWVLQQIQRVATACGGKKDVFITETGWPSKGDSNGVANPSVANQKSAVDSIKDTCGDAVTLFTAFNDLWKADGAYNAEKYWGIYSS